MNADAEELVERYQARLPGLVRAALLDYGVSDQVIAKRQIGWDGRSITVPVRDQEGRLAFLERWHDESGIGRPVGYEKVVELYPWQVLKEAPSRVVFAEGIHEALVFESLGYSAVAATGTGLFFKAREWAPLLAGLPEVQVAFRSGERRPRRAFLLSRSEVVERILQALPRAHVVAWPATVGRNGGAHEFFVTLRKSAVDFELLARRP